MLPFQSGVFLSYRWNISIFSLSFGLQLQLQWNVDKTRSNQLFSFLYNCFHWQFFHLVPGYVLVGHVMKTAVVSDEFECQQKCLGNNSCKSFNVHPSADSGKYICELNNKTRKMKPSDLKKKKGSNYYGLIKVSWTISIFAKRQSLWKRKEKKN